MLVLLFTDVESSTRLWEQHPSAMRASLARHDEILRACIGAHAGTVVKTTGDGFLATFATVRDGVAACLAMQQALGAARWVLPEPLRVRMGLHVGDAEPREGDLYGTAVNRAARIMAAAHGGQVLISAGAIALLDGSLPPGAGLRDLGSHRLKDLTQPEHLYQLTHPELAADFPPLVTLDARPNNLPRQVSEFFGREAELRAVRELLGRPGVRLVTLMGPGGTGKTRLGLQLAAELVEQYRDGVFFVDLSAEREAESVFEAILRDLGFSSAREGSPLQVLKVRLRERAMLLLLDNFEQVTEAATGLAELLEHCQALEVVVTSRAALRLRGEHVFPVPPLTLPDPRAPLGRIAASEAVRLFVDRARSVRPEFDLTDENAAAVAEISVRLDGLPLAIELAAARLKVFSAGDLLERLRRQVDVLGSGARDLPARQRTLRGTIAWSYDLLTADERWLFELLAVFATARLEAVEQVAAACGAAFDVLDVLASLVDKSLVRALESGGSQRFSMLQTIREYANERLAATPSRAAAVRAAHAEHYAGYAADVRDVLVGRDRETALAALAAELANLRAAWRYWVERGARDRLEELLDGLWTLFETRGWYHAAAELAGDLLTLLAGAPHSPARDQEEATLRASRARALMAVQGYTVDVEAEFTRAVALSTATDPAAQRFPVLRALATYSMNVVDFPRAAALGRQMLELGEREGDETMRVEGHLVVGLNTAFSGRVRDGLEHLDRVIALFDPARHAPGRFRLGTSPGVVARLASALLLRPLGHPERAAQRATEALDLARRLDHPFSLCYALYHAGFFELGRGRLETARARARELAVVAAERDYLVWQALASVLEGVALCGLGKADEGIALTEAGNDVYQGLTTPPVFWPPLLALQAAGFAMAGRRRRALDLVERAIDASGASRTDYAEFLTLRGDILLLPPEPDVPAAEQSYRGAVRGARTDGIRLTELAAATRLVTLPGAAGAGEDDERALRELLATFSEGFDEPELVAARSALGHPHDHHVGTREP
jgi:predicted ATPase/class 3 adenylate cyclase